MMKKQILLIFGLLLSNFLYSQTIPVGTYEAKISGWARGDTNHHCGEAFVNLEFQSGAVRFVTISYSENSASQNFGNSYSFKANNIPNSIYFSASRQIKESCNGDRPNNQGRIYSTSDHDFRALNFPFEFTNMTNVNSDGSGLWNSSGNILTYPKLTILDTSNGVTRFNYFEIDDPNGMVINSHTNFSDNQYNWEYLLPSLNPSDISVPAPDWLSLPVKFNGESSITLRIGDMKLANPNPKQYYGKILKIRQKGYVNSNEVSYSMIKTPPLLVSTTPPEKIKCSYSTDGKIQFTFNRPLETSVVNPLLNETFSFNLKWYDPIGLKYKDVVNSFDVVNTPTTSQCTLKNLPPGKYQATYQTRFPNDVITPNSPTTLSSQLKDLNDFEIKAPDPLKYKARMAQPKCATDGAEIVINATSGGTPPYSYTIKGTIVKPDKTTTDFEITKEFTNSAGTPNADHGQPNGDYIIPLDPELDGPVSIKVIDKNKCIDGNKTAP
jgi:hypothetical protein